MDSAGDAVLQLQVHLGDGVVSEDGGVGDITCRKEMSVAGPMSFHVCPAAYCSVPAAVEKSTNSSLRYSMKSIRSNSSVERTIGGARYNEDGILR